MHVIELAAYQTRLPLKRTIRHASHSRSETDNLVLACKLENGIVGFGEGVPRDYVTGETLEATWELLRQVNWPAAFAASVATFEAAVDLAEHVTLPNPADDSRGCRANGGRCALELAILDAFGQAYRRPLATVTALRYPHLFAHRERVQYSTAITSAVGTKLRMASLAMRLYGFRHLKLKVGIPAQSDVKRLQSVRRVVGRQMEIRLDANEAWEPAQAVQRIQELEPFGILAVEQPLRHEQRLALAKLRSQVAVPIMLDESLCSMIDAEQAVAQGLCDYFNLRLSKCGGFLRTLQLADFARGHGIGYQLGCQVGESAILSAAGRQFACSVQGIRWLEGSYDRRLVKEALGKRDITFGYGGWAPALAGGGLGIEVDLQALARVTLRREVLYAR